MNSILGVVSLFRRKNKDELPRDYAGKSYLFQPESVRIEHEQKNAGFAFLNGIIHFYYLDREIMEWKHRYCDHSIYHQTMIQVVALTLETDYYSADMIYRAWIERRGYQGWNEWR